MINIINGDDMEETQENKKDKKTKEEQIEIIKEKLNKISTKKKKKEEESLRNNIFKILKMEDFEIRHSNFLAWLFDTKSNRIISTKFTKSFLSLIKTHCKTKKEWQCKCEELDNVIKVLKSEEYIVKREDKYKDIMIEFKTSKMVVVIENKLYSKEHSNQLQRYYDEITSDKRFNTYNKFFVFLTLNGDEPIDIVDKQIWINISYVDILSTLKELAVRKFNNINNEIAILLKNYIQILEEKTEKTMDRIGEYFKLYENNKDAVNEMITYMPNIKERASIEKDYINRNENFTLISEGANVFITFLNNEIATIMTKNNLPKNLFTFGISNEPYNKMYIYVEMLKEGNYYKRFYEEFREVFPKEDKSKEANYIVIFMKNCVISNKKEGYLTEEQFHKKISESLKYFFEDNNSVHFKIVEFIKNYKFD